MSIESKNGGVKKPIMPVKIGKPATVNVKDSNIENESSNEENINEVNFNFFEDNQRKLIDLAMEGKIEEIEDSEIEVISKELNCPILLLKDIIAELLKPGFDVRSEFNEVEFSKDIKSIEDLKEGFIVSGVVRNITDFGAFVDIGLKNDGLIHISQISEKRISHPMDVLSINQQLKNIKVISIDLEKQRVGLSLK